MSVIIPAAGLGTRMKSYGPKSLIKINDTTIIEQQIKYINKFFYRPQIILVVGYQAEKVKLALKKKKITVVENKDWATTNVVSSIGLGLQHSIYNNVLIIYGDLVFNECTLKVPFGAYSMILTDTYGLMKDEEVGCTVSGNVVEHMMYDLPNKWAQIAYFTNKEKVLLDKISTEKKYDNYFGFEIINMIINSGGQFAVYNNQDIRITDIDSSKDLLRVEDILLCK